MSTAQGAPSSTAAATQPFAQAALYVGDLHPEVNESLLYELFNNIGPVQSVRVNRDANQRSLLYAYVNFQSHDDAERAMLQQNHKEIRGKPCRIMWAQRDPAARKSNIGNVYVKNLATSITSRKLEDLFSTVGSVTSCKVATILKGESNGYGFVQFSSAEEANAAIKKFNNVDLEGKALQVELFKTQKERGATSRSAFTNVFVKSLPESWTQADLEKYFGQYGQITSAWLGFDEEKKTSKMFGFVNFATPEQAAAAIEKANNVEIDGKKLFVGRAQKRDERDRALKERREVNLAEQRRKFDGTNLYVKNLPDDITADRLRDFFSKFGTVASVAVAMDQGRPKGFGFVSFSSQDEATKALTESNGTAVFGKPLYISLFQPRDVRRAQLEARRAAQMRFQQQAMMMGGMPNAFRGMAGGMGMNMGMMGMFPQAMARGPWGMMPNGMPMYGMQPMAGRTGPQGAALRGAQGQRGPARQGMPRPQQGQGFPAGQMGPQGPRQAPQNRVPGAQIRQTRPPVAAPAPAANLPLDPAHLASMPEAEAKNTVGERLYPLVVSLRGEELAPKLTGMLLEMDLSEILALLESREELQAKVDEAYAVYANSMQAGN